MTGAANDNASPRGSSVPSGRACPICGKSAVPEARPFCSKRCADVDLHRWLGGTYRIPVAEAEPGDEDGASDPET